MLMNIFGLICTGLGLVLLLTGILTDFWLVGFGSDLFHMGLWQSCSKNVCIKVTGSGYINATRGLLILSASLLIFGMIFSCLAFLKFHVGRITACLGSAVLESFSAKTLSLFLLVGMSIYTAETSNVVLNSSCNYQWSFYLCWSANVLLIISGICHLIAHRSSPIPGYESV
ncbi:lens fiber membrane intrinsic protein-like [Anomaloglossus baeobatrachus]|uniref:lens fiber membrane intrinsic protein-like n=1 Tax=Anomaloglossus baeobatrachus TaxID=238106 RepID=UPI003F50A04F